MIAHRPIVERLLAVPQSRYAIDREIAPEGGFSRVLAHDRERGAAVVLHVAAADAGPSLARIAGVAALSHPHVLEITDHGEAAGFLFFATPYVEAVTLRTWLERETRLPILESVRVLRETAEALRYAHERGVAHGALAPERVLWIETHVRLTGFSFASESEPLEADVRALGAIGYAVLAGRPPGREPVNALREALPPGLAFLVTRCLGPKPPGIDECARLLGGLVTPAPGYEPMQLVRQARYLVARGDAPAALDRLRRAAELAPESAEVREEIAALNAELPALDQILPQGARAPLTATKRCERTIDTFRAPVTFSKPDDGEHD